MLPGRLLPYLDELEALTEAMDPEIVSVGIETDFFWRAHPGQWPAFRDLLCTANTRLEARHPGIHVTTYFTLSSLVDSDGAPVQSGQDALRSLLPCIDSVGYSDYWADGNRHVEDIPPGYFLAAGQVERIRQRLRERVETLLEPGQVPEERLAMEVVLIAERSDITEETVRFRSHNVQFLETLDRGGEVGRRLNFLLQEMNREANTINSKAIDAEILQLAVGVKEEVEKLREQVQNLV